MADKQAQSIINQSSAVSAANNKPQDSAAVSQTSLSPSALSVNNQRSFLWRTICSALLSLVGLGAIGWGGLSLLQASEVPECVYLVDEQRQVVAQELAAEQQVAEQPAAAESASKKAAEEAESDRQIDDLEEEKDAGQTQQQASKQVVNPVDNSQLAAFNADALGKIIVQIAGAVENPGVYQLSAWHRIGDLIQAAGGLTADADQPALIRQFNLAMKLKDEQRIYVPFKQEQELRDWLQQYCQLASRTEAGVGTVSPDSSAGKSSPSSDDSVSTQTQTTSPSPDAGTGVLIDPAATGENDQDPSASVDQDPDDPSHGSGQDCISVNKAGDEELQTLTGVGPATAKLIIDNRPYLHITDLLDVKGIGQVTLEKLEPDICL